MQTSYITSAQKAQQLPSYKDPEVVFIGRSNCGKSSLLNALLNHKGLARASSTPGRTQMVNFFAVQTAGQQMIFADLPGYGFSAITHSVRQHWQELLTAYFQRPNLAYFLFLLDCRRAGELDADDHELLRYLSARPQVPLLVVLTKTDKVNQAALNQAKQQVSRQLQEWSLPIEALVLVSSLKKRGVLELRERLFSLLLHGKKENIL